MADAYSTDAERAKVAHVNSRGQMCSVLLDAKVSWENRMSNSASWTTAVGPQFQRADQPRADMFLTEAEVAAMAQVKARDQAHKALVEAKAEWEARVGGGASTKAVAPSFLKDAAVGGRGLLEQHRTAAEQAAAAQVHGRGSVAAALEAAKSAWVERTACGGMTTVGTAPHFQRPAAPLAAKFVEGQKASSALRLNGRAHMGSTLESARADWEARAGDGTGGRLVTLGIAPSFEQADRVPALRFIEAQRTTELASLHARWHMGDTLAAAKVSSRIAHLSTRAKKIFTT
jgi:hypothetical protein